MTCHDSYDITEPKHTAGPRYVVGVDGSAAAAAALRWAVDQAGSYGQVEAVFAYHASPLVPAARAGYVPPQPPPTLGQRATAEARATEYVEAALADRPDLPSGVTTVAVPGEPRHVLVEMSRGADVLVLGATHRTAFATRVLGSTASTCAAIAHCPVMVVPEAWVPTGMRVS